LNLRDGEESSKASSRTRSFRDDEAPKTKTPRKRVEKKSPIEDPDR
jgi:hypothetical protein